MHFQFLLKNGPMWQGWPHAPHSCDMGSKDKLCCLVGMCPPVLLGPHASPPKAVSLATIIVLELIFSFYRRNIFLTHIPMKSGALQDSEREQLAFAASCLPHVLGSLPGPTGTGVFNLPHYLGGESSEDRWLGLKTKPTETDSQEKSIQT